MTCSKTVGARQGKIKDSLYSEEFASMYHEALFHCQIQGKYKDTPIPPLFFTLHKPKKRNSSHLAGKGEINYSRGRQ